MVVKDSGIMYVYLDGIMYKTLQANFEAVIHVSFTHLCHQNCKYRQISAYRIKSRTVTYIFFSLTYSIKPYSRKCYFFCYGSMGQKSDTTKKM